MRSKWTSVWVCTSTSCFGDDVFFNYLFGSMARHGKVMDISGLKTLPVLGT